MSEENIEGIRTKILKAGLIPTLLHCGQQGYICAHKIIQKSELIFENEIAKGSGGAVFRGYWNNWYFRDNQYILVKY